MNVNQYLRDRAGLLLPRGVGVYTFPHRTFQEYLAACHLTDTDYPDKVAELTRRDPNRWREVALLAGAKAARGTSAAIWQLVDALCYNDNLTPADGSAADTWGALLAGQALVETAGLQQVSERNRPKLARVRRWLVSLIEGNRLPATERVAAGLALAHLGDPRPGVGISPLPVLGKGPGVRATLPNIAWCTVPAGPFIRGSKDDSLNPVESLGIKETPQQTIGLPTFQISRYPVTNAQFSAFVGDGGYTSPDYWREAAQVGYWNDGQVKRRAYEGGKFVDEWASTPHNYGSPFNLANHPVVGVNWWEALAFCAWLTQRLRAAGELRGIQTISLPSESQWEKAARGAEGWVYPWGNDPDPERANYSDTGIGSPSAVGCFPAGASPYGCLDMSGNVYEWCLTKFEESYDAYQDDNNKQGNSTRVLRGGAFHYTVRNVRCADRVRFNPDSRDNNLGFRLVMSPFS